MSFSTDAVTAEQRVAVSDARFDMRMTEKFDDQDAASTGWTWVTALFIAGVLIVSGYLDQESGRPEGAAAKVVTESYAANASAPSSVVATANKADGASDSGY